MSFTVRVRNFQSIKDETIEVDGFTVVTGPNNSGKSALHRAIRGVFTNAPAGPLVRHGEAHLIVEITFGDGQTVKWEKGWKKPGQKGGTINRYTVNGEVLPKVGRGAPPEVLALGIRPIKAGDRTLWPQVADQFTGVLFLVDTPGSVVAEAIADVDRVGKLSTALKLSETDGRKNTSKLNLRREDEEGLALEIAHFEGLDVVEGTITGLQSSLRETEKARGKLAVLTALRDRYRRISAVRRRLAGIREVQLPKQERVDKTVRTGTAIQTLTVLRKRLGTAQDEVDALAPVVDVTVSGQTLVATASEVQGELQQIRGLRDRLSQAVGGHEKLSAAWEGLETLDFGGEIPKTAVKTQTAVGPLTSLRDRLANAQETRHTLIGELAEARAGSQEVHVEVEELLGDRGECPTCGTAMDAAHLGAHA